MDIQRLRNLTTGRLHTEVGFIYEDIEYLTGEKGIMTHMLPRAMRALEPALRDQVKDARFWEDKYDTTHTGDVDVRPLNADEMAAFWAAYNAQPNPLDGKYVVVVTV